MSIERQLNLCSRQYGQWKTLALKAKDIGEVKKCLGKALFWMELQSAFLALWSVEQVHGKNPVVGDKLIIARANLSKKLADYAKETLNEIK
jgi:hypothetical protein